MASIGLMARSTIECARRSCVSYETIAKAFVDADLIARVRAAVAKEAFANDTIRHTITGQQVVVGGPDTVLTKFLWPVCIATETEYAYALGQGNPAPGNDPGVVSDGAIGAAVQVNWPTDAALLPKKVYLQVVEAGPIP
jgi:hypothetical protein